MAVIKWQWNGQRKRDQCKAMKTNIYASTINGSGVQCDDDDIHRAKLLKTEYV